MIIKILLKNITVFGLLFMLSICVCRGQCDYEQWTEEYPVVSNYVIHVELDHVAKKAVGRQQLTWKNTSEDTLYEIPFYMYLNAFKNMQSTYLKGSGGEVFGQKLKNKSKEMWGWIEMNQIIDGDGNDLTSNQKYIQLDDGNVMDQSVCLLTLLNPISPGDEIVLDIQFESKLPYIISRAGYSKNDYFFFNHWYPQPGVYEKNKTGQWGWNCHQFFRSTEFYADFGHYEFNLTLADQFVVGASGCQISQKQNDNGTKTYQYIAKNVIDFAWIAYPLFEEYHDRYKHVDIKALIPEEHCMMAPRYLEAVKYALEYLEEHVGPYPYPSITICDPPMHGLRSGLMEYPMLITCGSFYHFPKGIRTIESLVIHEFTHMYFMATLASNEKEEAWLDEGFVTFYEDKIMDHYYGEQQSLFDFCGYTSGNAENTRLEYTTMRNPSEGAIARPGWEIEGEYKGLIYAKTATMLRTFEGLIGNEVFEKIIKSYFHKWKFRHPKEHDFRAVANAVIQQELGDTYGDNMDWFFDPCLHGVEVVDYYVKDLTFGNVENKQGVFGDGNDKVYSCVESEDFFSFCTIANKGNLEIPVELLIRFENQSDTSMVWDGKGREQRFRFENRRIQSVEIDPNNKVPLDLNILNNSLIIQAENTSTKLSIFNRTNRILQNILEITASIF